MKNNHCTNCYLERLAVAEQKKDKRFWTIFLFCVAGVILSGIAEQIEASFVPLAATVLGCGFAFYLLWKSCRMNNWQYLRASIWTSLGISVMGIGFIRQNILENTYGAGISYHALAPSTWSILLVSCLFCAMGFLSFKKEL